jgi:hypothetical protein
VSVCLRERSNIANVMMIPSDVCASDIIDTAVCEERVRPVIDTNV